MGRFPSIDFADRMFVAQVERGFAGDIRSRRRGAIQRDKIGWDTIGGACPDDRRPALAQLLEP